MSLLSTLGLNRQGKNGTDENEDQLEKFEGSLKFRNNTITYNGTTLLIKHVTKFEEYGVKYVNSISTGWYIFSFIAAIVCLIPFPFGLIGTFIFGLIAYAAYKERRRPKLHGLTIELTSGSRHYFLSKDKKGVLVLLETIAYALENDQPINHTFIFEGDKIKGDKYEFNDSHVERVG